MRTIDFCGAINEGLKQEMRRDPSVFVYGIGVPDHKKVFGSTQGLVEEFGAERCFDTPLCEETMTGFALGAAINGMKPVHVHIRVDFLLLAMNQLVNMISSYSYLSGGRTGIPIVIRAIVGRGWGQGAQHSKSLHSFFTHIPGLKVVAPTRPYDAKGLLISSIREPNPVIFLSTGGCTGQLAKFRKNLSLSPLGNPTSCERAGTSPSLLPHGWLWRP